MKTPNDDGTMLFTHTHVYEMQTSVDSIYSTQINELICDYLVLVRPGENIEHKKKTFSKCPIDIQALYYCILYFVYF